MVPSGEEEVQPYISGTRRQQAQAPDFLIEKQARKWTGLSRFHHFFTQKKACRC
jgi:hypothetical protein